MKKGLIKKLIWITIFHILLKESGIAVQSETKNSLYSPPKWNPEARFRFAATKRRGLGQIDLFIPVGQDETSLFFLDLRFWRDTKNTTEGNYGLAYRKLVPSLEWIFGGYAFYDNRQTKHNNTFQQATLGVEALSELWDLRANTYIPFSSEKKVESSKPKYTYRGHREYVLTPKEVALKGIDIEIGRFIPGTDNLRFYVSGFHFQRSGVRKINGGLARLLWTVNNYIDLEADYRYDNVRHGTPIFWITFRLPFGEKTLDKLTPLERRMQEVIIRDIDIVTQSTKVPVSTKRQIIFASAGGKGDGTFESPTDSTNREVVTKLLNSHPGYMYCELSNGIIQNATREKVQTKKVPTFPKPLTATEFKYEPPQKQSLDEKPTSSPPPERKEDSPSPPIQESPPSQPPQELPNQPSGKSKDSTPLNAESQEQPPSDQVSLPITKQKETQNSSVSAGKEGDDSSVIIAEKKAEVDKEPELQADSVSLPLNQTKDLEKPHASINNDKKSSEKQADISKPLQVEGVKDGIPASPLEESTAPQETVESKRVESVLPPQAVQSIVKETKEKDDPKPLLREEERVNPQSNLGKESTLEETVTREDVDEEVSNDMQLTVYAPYNVYSQVFKDDKQEQILSSSPSQDEGTLPVPGSSANVSTEVAKIVFHDQPLTQETKLSQPDDDTAIHVGVSDLFSEAKMAQVDSDYRERAAVLLVSTINEVTKGAPQTTFDLGYLSKETAEPLKAFIEDHFKTPTIVERDSSLKIEKESPVASGSGGLETPPRIENSFSHTKHTTPLDEPSLAFLESDLKYEAGEKEKQHSPSNLDIQVNSLHTEEGLLQEVTELSPTKPVYFQIKISPFQGSFNSPQTPQHAREKSKGRGKTGTPLQSSPLTSQAQEKGYPMTPLLPPEELEVMIDPRRRLDFGSSPSSSSIVLDNSPLDLHSVHQGEEDFLGGDLESGAPLINVPPFQESSLDASNRVSPSPQKTRDIKEAEPGFREELLPGQLNSLGSPVEFLPSPEKLTEESSLDENKPGEASIESPSLEDRPALASTSALIEPLQVGQDTDPINMQLTVYAPYDIYSKFKETRETKQLSTPLSQNSDALSTPEDILNVVKLPRKEEVAKIVFHEGPLSYEILSIDSSDKTVVYVGLSDYLLTATKIAQLDPREKVKAKNLLLSTLKPVMEGTQRTVFDVAPLSSQNARILKGFIKSHYDDSEIIERPSISSSSSITPPSKTDKGGLVASGPIEKISLTSVNSLHLSKPTILTSKTHLPSLTFSQASNTLLSSLGGAPLLGESKKATAYSLIKYNPGNVNFQTNPQMFLEKSPSSQKVHFQIGISPSQDLAKFSSRQQRSVKEGDSRGGQQLLLVERGEQKVIVSPVPGLPQILKATERPSVFEPLTPLASSGSVEPRGEIRPPKEHVAMPISTGPSVKPLPSLPKPIGDLPLNLERSSEVPVNSLPLGDPFTSSSSAGGLGHQPEFDPNDMQLTVYAPREVYSQFFTEDAQSQDLSLIPSQAQGLTSPSELTKLSGTSGVMKIVFHEGPLTEALLSANADFSSVIYVGLSELLAVAKTSQEDKERAGLLLLSAVNELQKGNQRTIFDVSSLSKQNAQALKGFIEHQYSSAEITDKRALPSPSQREENYVAPHLAELDVPSVREAPLAITTQTVPVNEPSLASLTFLEELTIPLTFLKDSTPTREGMLEQSPISSKSPMAYSLVASPPHVAQTSPLPTQQPSSPDNIRFQVRISPPKDPAKISQGRLHDLGGRKGIENRKLLLVEREDQRVVVSPLRSLPKTLKTTEQSSTLGSLSSSSFGERKPMAPRKLVFDNIETPSVDVSKLKLPNESVITPGLEFGPLLSNRNESSLAGPLQNPSAIDPFTSSSSAGGLGHQPEFDPNDMQLTVYAPREVYSQFFTEDAQSQDLSLIPSQAQGLTSPSELTKLSGTSGVMKIVFHEGPLTEALLSANADFSSVIYVGLSELLAVAKTSQEDKERAGLLLLSAVNELQKGNQRTIFDVSSLSKQNAQALKGFIEHQYSSAEITDKRALPSPSQREENYVAPHLAELDVPSVREAPLAITTQTVPVNEPSLASLTFLEELTIPLTFLKDSTPTREGMLEQSPISSKSPMAYSLVASPPHVAQTSPLPTQQPSSPDNIRFQVRISPPKDPAKISQGRLHDLGGRKGIENRKLLLVEREDQRVVVSPLRSLPKTLKTTEQSSTLGSLSSSSFGERKPMAPRKLVFDNIETPSVDVSKLKLPNESVITPGLEFGPLLSNRNESSLAGPLQNPSAIDPFTSSSSAGGLGHQPEFDPNDMQLTVYAPREVYSQFFTEDAQSQDLSLIPSQAQGLTSPSELTKLSGTSGVMKIVFHEGPLTEALLSANADFSSVIYVGLSELLAVAKTSQEDKERAGLLLLSAVNELQKGNQRTIFDVSSLSKQNAQALKGFIEHQYSSAEITDKRALPSPSQREENYVAPHLAELDVPSVREAPLAITTQTVPVNEPSLASLTFLEELTIPLTFLKDSTPTREGMLEQSPISSKSPMAYSLVASPPHVAQTSPLPTQQPSSPDNIRFQVRISPPKDPAKISQGRLHDLGGRKGIENRKLLLVEREDQRVVVSPLRGLQKSIASIGKPLSYGYPETPPQEQRSSKSRLGAYANSEGNGLMFELNRQLAELQQGIGQIASPSDDFKDEDIEVSLLLSPLSSDIDDEDNLGDLIHSRSDSSSVPLPKEPTTENSRVVKKLSFAPPIKPSSAAQSPLENPSSEPESMQLTIYTPRKIFQNAFPLSNQESSSIVGGETPQHVHELTSPDSSISSITRLSEKDQEKIKIVLYDTPLTTEIISAEVEFKQVTHIGLLDLFSAKNIHRVDPDYLERAEELLLSTFKELTTGAPVVFDLAYLSREYAEPMTEFIEHYYPEAQILKTRVGFSSFNASQGVPDGSPFDFRHDGFDDTPSPHATPLSSHGVNVTPRPLRRGPENFATPLRSTRSGIDSQTSQDSLRFSPNGFESPVMYDPDGFESPPQFSPNGFESPVKYSPGGFDISNTSTPLQPGDIESSPLAVAPALPNLLITKVNGGGTPLSAVLSPVPRLKPIEASQTSQDSLRFSPNGFESPVMYDPNGFESPTQFSPNGFESPVRYSPSGFGIYVSPIKKTGKSPLPGDGNYFQVKISPAKEPSQLKEQQQPPRKKSIFQKFFDKFL